MRIETLCFRCGMKTEEQISFMKNISRVYERDQVYFGGSKMSFSCHNCMEKIPAGYACAVRKNLYLKDKDINDVYSRYITLMSKEEMKTWVEVTEKIQNSSGINEEDAVAWGFNNNKGLF